MNISFSKNATWERKTIINTGAKDIFRKGYIHEIDGTKVFGAWKEDSKCDSLVGLQEPSVFSPNILNDIDLFVGIMCRSIPLRKAKSINNVNLTTPRFTKYIHPVRYEPASYIFDSTADEESCYYNDLENQNLPKGVLGIQKCKFGAPFAVSFPHFLHANDW